MIKLLLKLNSYVVFLPFEDRVSVSRMIGEIMDRILEGEK